MADINLPVPGSDFNTWGEKLNTAVTVANDQGEPANVRNIVSTDIATVGSDIEGALSANYVGKGSQVLDVSDYADAQTAIDAAPAGSTVRFTTAFHALTAPVNVNKALTIDSSRGTQISQDTAGVAAFDVTASGVTFRGLRITGTQFAALGLGSIGIRAIGPSAAAPIAGLRIESCTLDAWAHHAIYCQYVTDFALRSNVIYNMAYAGLTVLSGLRGVVTGNSISSVIQGTGAVNSYGILLTRGDIESLVTDPRTSDVVVSGNVVDGVPSWEGIDTHGGQRIIITGNTVRDTFVGIALVPATGSGVTDYGPIDCIVSGNTIDSGVSDGTRSNGINFVGVGTSLGTATDAATGTIVGNTIRGHGTKTSDTSGAIVAYYTRGLVVSSNQIIEPSPNGIVIYHTNYGYTVSGNTVTDAWSDGTNTTGVILRSTDNEGLVSGNVLQRGAKIAASVFAQGVRIANASPTVKTILGPNGTGPAVVPLVDAGNFSEWVTSASAVSVGRAGAKVGLYGVPVVARATAIGSPTVPGATYSQSEAASMRASIDAMRVALKNIGVTA